MVPTTALWPHSPRVNPAALPLVVGVALPYTSRPGKLVVSNPPGVDADSQLFNFYDSVYEFSADNGCQVDVTAHEYSATDIQGVIYNQFGLDSGVRGLTFFGDRGAIQVYQYQQKPGSICPSLGPDDPNPYSHAINAFYEIDNPRSSCVTPTTRSQARSPWVPARCSACPRFRSTG